MPKRAHKYKKSTGTNVYDDDEDDIGNAAGVFHFRTQQEHNNSIIPLFFFIRFSLYPVFLMDASSEMNDVAFASALTLALLCTKILLKWKRDYNKNTHNGRTKCAKL